MNSPFNPPALFDIRKAVASYRPSLNAFSQKIW